MYDVREDDQAGWGKGREEMYRDAAGSAKEKAGQGAIYAL
jgi:hypothetical protein